MPRAKPKPPKGRNRFSNGAVASTSAEPADVLTLAEAAAYLRVAERDVLRMAKEQALPGRLIGADWRFLRSALQRWLSAPAAKSSKETLLGMAGAFRDDPYLEDIVREAYRRRGRPVTEDDE